ncbi:hypothetical protein [Geoglobus ahangari]
MQIELPENLSLTFYLMASGKKNRKQTSVWIEKIYLDKLKEDGVCLSDLVNFLLEQYLRQKGKLDVKEIIESIKKE